MKRILLLSALIILGITGFSQTSTFTGTGLWSEAARWDNGVPTSAIDVIIGDGAQCTIDLVAECNSLTFATNSTSTLVAISGSNSLTITGALVFTAPTVDNFHQTMDIGAGTLVSTGITMANTANGNRKLNLNISTGTVTVNGNIVMSGGNTENYITFTDAGVLNVTGNLGTGNTGRLTGATSTINIGGNFDIDIYTANTSTIVFNNIGDQRVDNQTYYNIVINNGGSKYLVANTTIATGGNITFNNGLLNLAGFDLTVTSTATFSGTPSATSMINFANGGRLAKTGTVAADWQRTFPIGTGADYSPVIFSTVAGSDVNGTLYIKVVGERHPLLNGADNAIKRYWDFNSTNTTFTSITGSLTYTDNDVASPITEGNLIKTGRLYSGWTENQAGTSYDHGNNQLTLTATPSIFGAWTLGENTGCFDLTLPDKYTVANGNWNTAAIWNGGTVPTDGQSVSIMHTVTRDVAINPSSLTISSSGVLDLNNVGITVSGATHVYGRLTDGSNTGINTFQGKVTVYAGGTWATTTEVTSGEMVFQGGISNAGTFNAGSGDFTATQDIEGATAISFANAVRIGAGNVLTNKNTSTVSITGTLDGIGGGAEWINDVNSTLNYRNATQPFNTNGTFTVSASPNTVIYGLNGAQAIRTTGTTYHHLNIEGGNTKTATGLLTVNGNLTFQNLLAASAIATSTNNIVITGNIVAGNSGFSAAITQTTGTLLATNLLVNGTNTFNLNSNSTFAEDITVTNNSILSLNQIGANAFNISVRDVIVNNGSTLNNGAADYTNTLTLNRNATINGTFNLWIDVNSRTNLVVNGDVAHAFTGTPTGFNLYNLTLNPTSNTTTAGFAFDIEGSVNIGLGSIFDAGTFNHTVLVDWTNSGTLTNAGTFNFDGGTQNIGIEPNFNHVTFSTAGTKTFTGNVAMAGNLNISNATVNIANGTTNLSHSVGGNVTITSGSLNTNAANAIHSFSIGGDLTINGTLDFYVNATQNTNLTITGNIPHTITGTPVTFEVNNVSLAASSNTTTFGFDILTSSTDYIRGNINVGNGATLDLNGKDIDIYGNITIDAGGALQVDENALLTFYAASKSIQNAGTLSIVGTAGNLASLSASAVGNRFYIDNASGSLLLMKYFTVDYLTGNGISAVAGATVDGIADNFSNGTFGANCNSAQCLQLTGVDFPTNNPVTATSTIFNNPSGYNVNRSSGTGAISFVNAAGNRAGESFDNDNANPGTLVNWTYPASTYYTVNSGNFLDPAIWNNNPTGHFTDASAVFQIMDGHNVTLNGDIDVLELIVGNGVSGNLIIGNDATVRNLTTRESLTVQTGGSISIGSDANHIINIYGNLVNNGTTNFRNSFTARADVNFYGSSTKVNGSNPITFSSVTFKTGTVTTAHTSMDINWNLKIEDGATFNDGNLSHTVAGDWTETGTGARTGSGTITFDETASTIKSTTNNPVDFYNVVCNGTGSVVFATDLNAFTTNITGDLTINNDKVVLLTDDAMNISGNFTAGAASRFTSNASLVNFNGTSNQNISLLGDVTFWDVTFSGASTKTITGNIKAGQDLTISAGAIVEGSGSHEIIRDLNVNGICNFSGAITMKGRRITSTANTSIDFGNLANLNIANNVELYTLSSLSVNVNGNVTIQSNYLIVNNNTNLTGTGTFTLGTGLNLYIRDDNGFPSGFALYDLSPTSNVLYDRDMDQVVRGGASITYGNVFLENAVNANPRIRTADGAVNIMGTLYFQNDAISFNVAGYDLSISGNISNTTMSSIIDMTLGGTLTFNAGDANQTMNAATYNLTNLVFTLPTPSANRTKTIAAGSALSLEGNFSITNAGSGGIILDVNINDNSIAGTPQTLTVGQNTRLSSTAVNIGTSIFNNFVTKDLSNGTIHFANTTATQYIPHNVTYGNITFSGNQIKEATGPLNLLGTISVTANTPDFRGAGHTINVAGNWQLGIANTTTFVATDKVVLNGIEQTIYPSNFQNLEIANTGIDSISGPAGAVTIYGNFTVKNGATFAARTRSINIYGNWVVEASGEFTQEGAGVVTFANTTANQTIQSNSNSYFSNITITKNNGIGNQTVTANTDLVLKNSLVLTTDRAVFDLNNRQLNIGGSLTVNDNQYYTSNAFIAGTSTVIFDGIVAQIIRHFSSYPLTFHHITFSTTTNKEFYCQYNPAVLDPTRKIIVTGNWTNNGQNVYGYIPYNGGNTYVNFDVAGNWINNGTFYHLNLATVTFNGANQNIGTSDFWNVVFAGTGTKTLQGGAMTVKQDLTISNGVTLDVNATENNNILVNRNWDMSTAGAIFEARQGLVSFDGGGTIITGHTDENTNKNFYNIDFSANFTITGDLDVDNNFSVLSNTFTTGNNKVFIGGNFLNSGTFTHTNNAAAQVIFNATGGTKQINPGAGVNFRTLTINATGGTVYELLNNFTLNNNYDFTVNQGTFNLKSNDITVNDNNTKIVINSGGELIVNEGASIIFNGNTQSIRNQGGIFKLLGIAGSTANLTRTAGSYYVTQTSGVFHAKYYRCEGIGITTNSGITISGGTLDAINNLSNGDFISGASNANTTAYIDLTGLPIDNTTNLTISQITFNGGGTTNKNVRRQTAPTAPNNGYATFSDCIGSLSGASYELDDASATTGFLRWVIPSGFYWVGNTSDDWHTGSNWLGGIAPSDTNQFVYFDIAQVGTNKIAKISTNDAKCGRIVINGAAIGFSLEGGYDLIINGDLVVSTGGLVTVTSPTSEISIWGDWTNNGTFNHGSSTVKFYTKAGTSTITSGLSPFYNMYLYSKQGNTFTLGSNLNVDNNFTLVKGTFDVVARDMFIKGNWLLEADSVPVFLPKSRTVTFSGTNQNISNGTFNILATLGTGTINLLTSIEVNGAVNIGTGTTLNGNENDLLVAGNWINYGTFTQTGNGSVVFDGGNQQIDNTGSTTTQFNKVTFAGTGTKTFYKASIISGDAVVNNGCNVDFSTFTIDGGMAANTLTNNGSIYLGGPNNFPINFETITMSSTSNVIYRYAIGDQIVKNSTEWSYGNLYLQNNSGTNYNKIVESGDLKVSGGLTISHTDVIMDMATNSANLILTGGINFPAGGQQISWGTGTSKLTHIGGDWGIDADITGFNNIEFAGTTGSYKAMYNNLNITGDVTIKSDIYLIMDPWNQNLPKTMTCTQPAKTFTMESNSRVYASTPSSTDVAMPRGFSVYSLNSTSWLLLRSLDGVDQTLYTGNNITYGRITFQNTKNVTTDGVSTLRVNGDLNMGTCTFTDGGQSIIAGGSIITIYNYTPTIGVTFTFNGGNQAINNNALFPLRFENVTFSGAGTKTMGNNNTILINGNLTVNNGIIVSSTRPITFNGANWTNNGKFKHTSTLTVSGTGAQSIKAGTSDIDTYFTNLVFSGSNAITFITNGADINGTFDITSTANVSMGTLSHTIAGTVTNISGGVWNTANANITFDGGNQNINTPLFTAKNITISGTGTKRMFSNWDVADLTISASILNNFNNIATYSSLTVRGNYSNLGTFTHNDQSSVIFNANSNVSINNGANTFWVVNFGDDAGATNLYNLTGTTTTIRRTINLFEDAHVKLNGNILVFGYNTANPKLFTVKGIMEVDANASLQFQNQGSVCTMNVDNGLNPSKAILRIVGANNTQIATLTRNTAGGQFITINRATIEAKYYLIEYLANTGMDIQANATLHSTNNFSNGTFSNINNVAGACYLNLEAATYTGGIIADVVFNIAGTPVANVYNVKRQVSSPNITFSGIITGNLGNYKYEKDELTVGSPAGLVEASRGKLQWPGILETTWTGTISADWNNPLNWTDGVPTSAIDAIIPDVDNDPIMNVDGECRKLRITTGILRLANGYNVTTNSDVNIGEGTNLGKLIVLHTESVVVCGGNFTLGTNGTFTHGGATVVFNSGSGNALITPLNTIFNNVEFNNIASTFTLAGSTFNVLGNFSINNGTVLLSTLNYTLNLGGNFNNQGTFTPGTGTVNFNGTTDQTITNGNFNKITVNGSAKKLTTGQCVISGTTIVNSILEANVGSNIDFNGDVTINSGATFNDGGSSHTFSGANWRGTGNYLGNGTITFDLTTANPNLYASKFNNLIIACTGRIPTLFGNIDIAGNLIVQNNTATFNIKDFLIYNTTGLGSFNVENSTIISISGANNFPMNFLQVNLASTTTTEYRGGVNQEIRGGSYVRYGNLSLFYVNTKTLNGDIEILGNLTINTATLDVSTNNYTIGIYGQWNNNNVGGGTFVPRQGEVLFNGAVNQYINVADNSNNPFYHLTINNATGTISAPNNKDLLINGNLTVTNGIYSANNRTTTVGGDFYAVNGSFVGNGSYILNKPTGTARIRTNYDYSTNTKFLNNLTINGNAVYTLESDMAVYGHFNLLAGTLNGSGNKVALGNQNTDNINIAGKFISGPAGKLLLGDATSLVVSPTGTIELVGTGAQNVVVSNNIHYAGRYAFTCNGTIKAEYYQFNSMNVNGIWITSTGVIDAVHNFSNGTFTNGPNNVTFLKIDNTQSFVNPNYIENVSFPTNPGGGSQRNVEKSADSGNLEFWEATGIFAGEDFDKDDFNRINWTGDVILTWNGIAGTDWNNPANWTPNFGPNKVPSATDNVIIAPATNNPKITIFGAQAKNLTINTGAKLTIETPLDGGLADLTVSGDFLAVGSATFELKTINDYIEVAGNWTIPITSTFTNNGNISFNGNGSAKTIDNGGKSFKNLNITGTSVYSLGRATDILGDLTINSGSTLDVSGTNYAITIKGNWNNSGTFNCQTGSVTFNAATGPRTIDNNNSYFNTLVINAFGVTYSLANHNLSVNANFNLQAGTFNQNQLTVNMGNGAGTDNLNVTGTGVYSIGPNGVLKMGSSSIVNVSTGGTFNAVGSNKDNPAIITRQSVGTYSFNVENTAKFGAQFYLFEYMNASGIWLKNGAILNAANNLSNGVFSNGAVGGTYLKLENTLPNHPANEIIDNVTFNSGPVFNVTRTTGTTIANFRDALGVLGGYLYENDAIMPPEATTGLLEWANVNSAQWNGLGLDNSWHNPANWQSGVVPSITNNVTIPASINNPSIYEADAQAKSITVEAGATLTINGFNFTVDENIWYAGTITAIGTPTITGKGSWTSASGTFNPGNSTVSLAAVTGSQTISPGASNFYNLEINTGGSYNAQSILRTNKNLTITAGTLNSNGFDIYVAGSWTKTSGTFTPGVKTVFFNGTGTNILHSGGGSFYNVNFTGSATTLLNSNLTITNQLTQNAGTIDLSSDGGTTSYNLSVGYRLVANGGSLLGRAGTISVGDNWSFTGTSTFTPGTSTVIFTNNSGTRTITPRNQPFYNLTINGAATYNLGGATTINGDLSILNGTFSVTTLDYPIGIKGNWINNGSFTPYTGVVTFNGAVEQSISGATTQTFGALTLNNTSATGLVLSRAVIVKNVLTLTDGILYSTLGNLLTLNDNATTTPGSNASFVDGPMKKIGNDAFTFPLGDGTVWAPLAITNPGLTTDAFTAQYFFTKHPLAEKPCDLCDAAVKFVSLTEYWDITRDAGTSTPNVTLYFKDMARSTITNLTDLIFAHYNGSNWVRMGSNTGVSDGANMCHVTGTGFTSYSPVLPASESGSNALPIELVSFNAVQANSNVQLSWTTKSEINNSYFTVERSKDGLDFSPIAQIDGAGNSNTDIEYQYLDKNVPQGLYYYRLTQTDFDGKSTQSSIIIIYVDYGYEPLLTVFPNPSARNEFTIRFVGNADINVKLVMFDILGKVIYNEDLYLPDGKLNHKPEISESLLPGPYYIILVAEERTYRVPLIIIK